MSSRLLELMTGRQVAASELCVWFVVGVNAAFDYKIHIKYDTRVFINLTQSGAEAHFQFCYDYELMPESDI